MKTKKIEELSNRVLLDRLVSTATELSIASDSYYFIELRAEVLSRMSNGMTNNKFDLTTPTDCSNAFGCPHFINGKPSF